MQHIPQEHIAEIIEFSGVAVNSATGTIESEFQVFVKPSNNPKLEKYCEEATGVTQEDINNGVSWSDAVDLIHDWLTALRCASGEVSYAFVTFGDYDLGTMVPKQCRLSNMAVPTFFKAWLNFKVAFGELYGIPGASLMDMMRELKLEMVGLQHGGVDACRNGARVLTRAIWDGKVITSRLTEGEGLSH